MTETATPAPWTTEKTFSAYNAEQANAYSQIRRGYHPKVYQTIIDHHSFTGGQLNTLLDVGCGPGTSIHKLAQYFTHAIGLDPSEGMIATARSLNVVTAASEAIRFEVSTAESLGEHLNPPIQGGSVDLITASNAAHWFDMSGFWPSAARVLKPGGSVALWCSGEIRAHPDMPNAPAVQAAMDAHREQRLKPYLTAGNDVARSGYKLLAMPWTLPQPETAFDKGTFFRKEFGVSEPMHVGEVEVNMDAFEMMMGTGSATTRWREAHPDAVGTEGDVVRLLRREIEKLLHEAGVEGGKEKLKGYAQGALLIVKKRA